MADVTIFHNPVCSKSRGALDLLRERGVAHETVEYLKTPPGHATLERILTLLAGPPGELVRKDGRFKELGLSAADYTTRDQVIGLLLEHPELMERPVVIRGDRAVIARPPERVLELLE
jgi:arsenate reductase